MLKSIAKKSRGYLQSYVEVITFIVGVEAQVGSLVNSFRPQTFGSSSGMDTNTSILQWPPPSSQGCLFYHAAFRVFLKNYIALVCDKLNLSKKIPLDPPDCFMEGEECVSKASHLFMLELAGGGCSAYLSFLYICKLQLRAAMWLFLKLHRKLVWEQQRKTLSLHAWFVITM